MIVMTSFSEESTLIARITRDLLAASGEEVILAPQGTTGIFISIDEESNGYVLYVTDDFKDLDVVNGFVDLEECWKYARCIAAVLGLEEEDIDSDVFEAEPVQPSEE